MASVYANVISPFEGNHSTLKAIVISLIVLYIGSKIASYRRGLRAVNNIPGFRVPFQPFGLPGAVIPTTWWNPGMHFIWDWRDTLYKRFGNDTFSLVPFLAGNPVIYTANLDVTRQVASTSGGKSFYKPENASRSILLWGMNIVAANGDVWKKHRRIMGPAFDNHLYEIVWAETVKIYREMVVEEGWTNKDQISLPAVQAITFKLALLIIGKCGFGFSFSWSDPARTADGRMTTQQALRTVAETFLLSTFVPKWILKMLPLKSFRECVEAHRELIDFMHAQIAERKADVRGQGSEVGRDAFSLLVKASEEEEGKFKLDDSELIGNVYIMLFAGHETTAHSLAATIGFLSENQDIQEEIYQQIISVVGHEGDPKYSDYAKLNKVLAAFYEALRLFPSGYVLVREAFEDTALQIPNPEEEGGSRTVPVAKGTQMIVDMIGVQYNPRYFDNPKEYRPSRWYEVTNESEAYTAFSIGPRACIGRKFASTESVCFLTLLMRDYKIEPMLKGSGVQPMWKESVKLGITLGVNDVPVTFVRRKH